MRMLALSLVAAVTLLPVAALCQPAGPSAQDSARALYRQAMVYHEQEDWPRVVALCQKAVALDPFFTEAHRELLDHVENRDSLRTVYERLNQRYPDSPVFYYLLGRLTEDEKKKEALYRSALAKDSTYAWGYIGLGAVFLQKQDFEQAAAHYQRATELDPKGETAYRGLIATYQRAGHSEKVLETLQRYRDACPERVDAYLSIGKYWEERQEYDQAVAEYRAAYERFKNDSLQAPKAMFSLIYALKDTTEKVRLAEQFVQRYPLGFNAGWMYSFLLKHYKAHDPEKGMALALDLIRRQLPHNQRRIRGDALIALHDMYLARGDSARADSLVQDLLQRDEANPLLYMQLATKYSPAHPEKALALYHKARDIASPESIYNTMAFGNFSRDRLDTLARQIKFRAAISIAELLSKQQRYREVASSLEPLRDWTFSSEYMKAYIGKLKFLLGQAYVELGREQEALSLLHEALIRYKMDEARRPMETAYKKAHGSTGNLADFILEQTNRYLASDTARVVQASAAMKRLSVDEAIVQARIRLSRRAPAFTLTAMDGTQWTPESRRNKVLVLNFWATWCGPCRQEMPHLQKAYEHYQSADDVLFVAVSIDDSRDVVERFLEKHGYTFPVAHQPKLAEAFGVTGIPTTLIITGDGVIHHRWTGFNPEGDLVAMLQEKIEPLRRIALK